MKQARFERLGVFAYSAEEGTPAAGMDGQVDEDVKQRRRQVLLDIQAGISAELLHEKRGQILTVLVEGPGGSDGTYTGRTSWTRQRWTDRSALRRTQTARGRVCPGPRHRRAGIRPYWRNDRMKHVPNTLSIIRIFAACAVLVTMLTVPPEKKTLFLLVPGLLFVLASITDLIDGYIARKYELITDFGKFIDPIGDKLLTVFAMLGFLQIDADEGKLFMFIAIAVTLLREFVVSS